MTSDDEHKYGTELLAVDWDDPASIERACAYYTGKQPLMLAWINEMAQHYAAGGTYIPEPVYSYAQCCFMAGASYALTEIQKALGAEALLAAPELAPLLSEIVTFRKEGPEALKRVSKMAQCDTSGKPT